MNKCYVGIWKIIIEVTKNIKCSEKDGCSCFDCPVERKIYQLACYNGYYCEYELKEATERNL